MTPFLLVIVAICFSVAGELCLKSGMDQIGIFSLANFGPTLRRILTNARILTGFASLGVGAIFWLAVLSRANLSWAYPMLSLGYILVLLFSALILKEPVSAVRWIGALVVVLGVFMITRT